MNNHTKIPSSFQSKLPLSTKIYYLFGDIGISLHLSAVAFFLLFFFSDVVHIDPALVGTVLLLGKLWDAVNDPLFGWISDRTRSRFGRRKVYLLFGTLPLGITFALIWAIPKGLSETMTIAYMLISFFLFYFFLTIVSVSYYAMTPELTRDYDERTSLTTFRMIGGSIGYMAGAALPPLIAGLYMTQSIGWMVMGILFGVFAVLCIFVTYFGVKMDKDTESPPSRLPAVKSVLVCFRNRPYNFILGQGLITGMAFMLVMSYMSFYITYQLDMKDKIPLLMTLYIGTISIFLFFWKWLSDRWAKGPTYALGLFIAFGTLSMSYFIPQGKSSVIYILLFISAFGMSAQWVLPWSILPDVIEYDELMTGERREGMYYGLKGLLGKISDALGLFIGGWALKLFQFVPEMAQSDQSLLGIRLFFGPVPALLVLISLPLLIWFPINRKTHKETLIRLEKIRAKQGESTDDIA